MATLLKYLLVTQFKGPQIITNSIKNLRDNLRENLLVYRMFLVYRKMCVILYEQI